MRRRKKTAASGARMIFAALRVVLALLLTAVIIGTAYAVKLMNRIQRVDSADGQQTLSSSQIEEILKQEDETVSGPTVAEEDVDFGTAPTESIKGENLINILLIGQDRRPGEPRQRSDAMILCTLNTDTKTLTMTSFLRDMYVQIPGYGNNKMNACYALGGMELLNDCIELNFGVQVDANIEVDFGGFTKLVDMMGGVDIELTGEEAAYLNKQGFILKTGMNRMSGEEALAYSRIRYIGMDFERTERQRRVITALIGNAKTMKLTELMSVTEEALGLITTDMTNQQIISYVMELSPMLSGLTIQNQRVPVEGSYYFANISGAGSCIIIDFDTNRKMLYNTLME